MSPILLRSLLVSWALFPSVSFGAELEDEVIATLRNYGVKVVFDTNRRAGLIRLSSVSARAIVPISMLGSSLHDFDSGPFKLNRFETMLVCQRLSSLRSLRLNGAEISRDALKHLAGETITSLDLSNSVIEPGGLSHMKGLVSLVGLSLNGIENGWMVSGR